MHSPRRSQRVPVAKIYEDEILEFDISDLDEEEAPDGVVVDEDEEEENVILQGSAKTKTRLVIVIVTLCSKY